MAKEFGIKAVAINSAHQDGLDETLKVNTSPSHFRTSVTDVSLRQSPKESTRWSLCRRR